jgi:hypothetical protein
MSSEHLGSWFYWYNVIEDELLDRLPDEFQTMIMLGGTPPMMIMRIDRKRYTLSRGNEEIADISDLLQRNSNGLTKYLAKRAKWLALRLRIPYVVERRKELRR